MRVYNLTKHNFTNEQLASADCVDVPDAKSPHLQDFTAPPSDAEFKSRAAELMQLALAAGAKEGDSVLLASAMYFIPSLVAAAKAAGFIPTFSFTQRVSQETKQEDGSIKQVYIFRHEGWIFC